MTTSLVERPAGKAFAPSAEGPPQEYHWTVASLHRAVDAGVFDEPSRIELVRGRVMDRMSQGPLHRATRVRLGRRLRTMLEPRLLVIEECTLPISFDGEPVVDVAVLNGTENDYEQHNPTPEDAALLVEVAVSSKEHDLGEKAQLYAEAGIGDYWVVLPERAQVVVHREPGAEGFASVVTLGQEDVVAPLAAPAVTLSLAELFAR